MVAPARAPLRTDRLRAVNEPQPAVVECDAQHRPLSVRGTTIESVNETWRIDDEWWRQAISRLYMEVMLEGGKRTVLFRDLVTGEWFAQMP